MLQISKWVAARAPADRVATGPCSNSCSPHRCWPSAPVNWGQCMLLIME